MSANPSVQLEAARAAYRGLEERFKKQQTEIARLRAEVQRLRKLAGQPNQEDADD